MTTQSTARELRPSEALKREIFERQEAEMQAHVLIDAVPHQIWSGPPDGTLDFCNERWRSYMGITLEELQGDGWQTMLHPDDRDRVLQAWRESVVNGTPYEQEERHRGADGKYRWFLVRGLPRRDQEGRIVRWYGTNTDIEDRKQAEEAFQAQALRYKTLMETSTDSIYVLDKKGNLREANAAFLRRRGYTAAEAHGLNVADWDAQLSRAELQEKLRQLVGGSAVFETRHRCKDGSVFEVEVCTTSVRVGGEQLFFAVTRDITERKQAEDRLRRSEEKFKALFGIAPVGISVLDPRRNIVEANSALEQIVRMSREELLGGAYRRRTYLNADGTPRPLQELASELALNENRSLHDVETGIVTEDGEIIWTQVSVAPLALPDGSAVVITQDITARKRMEAQLQASRAELRSLATNLRTAREEEAIRISREIHDQLGQALTGLQMDVAALGRALEQEEQIKERTELLAKLETMSQAIERTLQTARRVAAELRPAMLDELGLAAAIEWQTREFEERSAVFCNLTLPPTGPALDAERATAVFRIFQEVLTNIARHAQATEVSVELRAETAAVVLEVRDNGLGIESIESAHRRGHGLVGMQERALAAGLRLQVTSRPGEGTAVMIEAPSGASA